MIAQEGELLYSFGFLETFAPEPVLAVMFAHFVKVRLATHKAQAGVVRFSSLQNDTAQEAVYNSRKFHKR